MRAEVKWTNLSRRQISQQLNDLGTPASKRVVADLLWEHGYRRRKAQKKKTMGQHADRNSQFENIARLKQEYLNAGQPVISIDTKKQELLGNFSRAGVTDAEQPLIVNDHDFVSQGRGTCDPARHLRRGEESRLAAFEYQPRHDRIGLRQHRTVVA